MKTQPSALSGSSIELLEPRIAPASITFTDVDGDTVTVTVSGAATTADLDHAVHRAPSGSGFKITGIDLTKHSVFQNADLIITADVAGGGDGHVNVSGIDARKLDLHDVTIDGTIGQIDVGDKTTSTPALNHLTAESIGVVEGVAGDGPASSINGGIGTLEVHGDVNKAWIRVSAGKAHRPDGSIDSIKITGDIIGGNSKHSGSITATGEITDVTVGGDLLGGKGQESGAIGTLGKIVTFTGKGISGNAGKHSGALLTRGGIGTVELSNSLAGGTGFESGAIGSLLEVAKITVHGDVMGGVGKRSGAILSKFALGTVVIDGSLVGGLAKVSGVIGSDGNIGSVQIGGNLDGGQKEFTGAILSGRNIGTITITGSMRTDSFIEARFTAIVSARGQISSFTADALSGRQNNRVLIAAATDGSLGAAGTPAIGTLKAVSVEYSTILGGFAFLPGHTYKNADASIGTVTIAGISPDSGSWAASTLAAGALDPDLLFRGLTEKDTNRRSPLLHDGGKKGVFSSITSVTISGELHDDPKGGFISGFIAEQIFSATCTVTLIAPLSAGAHNDQFTVSNPQGDVVALVSELIK